MDSNSSAFWTVPPAIVALRFAGSAPTARLPPIE